MDKVQKLLRRVKVICCRLSRIAGVIQDICLEYLCKESVYTGNNIGKQLRALSSILPRSQSSTYINFPWKTQEILQKKTPAKHTTQRNNKTIKNLSLEQ